MTQLLRSAPYFPVRDIARAVEHYQRVLGFQPEYVAGSPPEFAIVARDGFSIMLRLVADPERISPNERQGGSWDVFFWVTDVQALHTELASNRADIVYGPILQPAYHMEELAVRDADGYVLGFGQATTR